MHARGICLNRRIRALCLSIVFVVILGLAPALGAATADPVPSGQWTKATGHVKGISPEERRINIDGIVYDLDPALVVRDDLGAVMQNYRFSYFSFVDLVEFTSRKNVIREIRILKLTS